MNNIQIITDSMTDVPKYLVDKYSIRVVPLTINFEDGEYRDGVDLTGKAFYQKLTEVNELPKTSQVTPNTFIEVFKETLKEGKEVICINGSSKASGTHQAALLAKNELNSANSNKIDVFDTMGLCFGGGFYVYEAAKMIEEGKSRKEIVDMLKKMKSKIDHIFTVETLEYLKKGGRLNPMKATIATILNVKPILTVVDGLVEPLDKVRGSKKVIGKMIALAKERGGDFTGKTIAIAHANDPKKAEALKEVVLNELKPKEIIMTEIGCTIGTHAGPGTLAIFYHK
ncbi:DegV family protein [Clostridium formicaceticum]|uniref:DegV domain-containing protein n=1 Tax=Clostridium formicaceticum TaxID=1497 RepID=A0AAC9RMV5_9CLOT|nr:DegV family protein [Clostridium formicaceticum]AOY77905.1 fatty acid-binding protein DegV [Clostridium formicaceticum]ARE88522.1 DegV domain-containing protein [Clostridium formicaceticum]